MRDLASSGVFLSHSIDLILGFDPEVGSSCDCHCCCSPPLLGKKQDMVIVLAGTSQLASLSIVTCHSPDGGCFRLVQSSGVWKSSGYYQAGKPQAFKGNELCKIFGI